MLLKAISKIYSSFLSLLDTPTTYSGQGGKFVKVNTGETGLEFGTGSGSLWTQSGSAIYYNTGNVGVGTADPKGNALRSVKSVSSVTEPYDNHDLMTLLSIQYYNAAVASPYSNVGSAGHFLTEYGNTNPNAVGTQHTFNMVQVVHGSGNGQNEFTPLFGFHVNNAPSNPGRIWGMDYNVQGPVDAQADLLLGPSFFLNNYNSGVIANGGWGEVICSKPDGGAQGGAVTRLNLQTYPLDAGLCIVGWSGTANKSVETNAYNTALQIGGYAGGWMSSGMTSKFGTGIKITDWTSYGINIPSRKAGGTGPSIAVASGAGRAEFLSGIKVGNFTETASAGAVKYDATNSFQGYHNGAWGALGGGVNAFDGGAFTDTYVATVNFDGGAF